MGTHAGPRAKYWFGKHVKSDEGTELTSDAAGRAGKVSESKRWFSYDWWFGHNLTRATDGTWAGFDKRGKAPAPRHPKVTADSWGSGYESAGSLKTTRTRAIGTHERQQDYQNHLVMLEDQATNATNGYMLTPAGKAKGYSDSDFFAFNVKHRPPRRYMTEELRAWMKDGDAAASDDAGTERIMTYREWERRKKDTPEAHTPTRAGRRR